MEKGKTIILVVIALVVLGLLIWVGSNQSTVPENNANGDEMMEQNDNNNDVDSQDEADLSQEEGEEGEDSQQNNLPPAVFNTSGEITDISSDSITVQTDGSHMTSGENVEVTVVIGPSTNILDADNNNISLSDLSEGDSLSIEGSSNIKDVTTFEGSNIKLAN